MPAHVAVAQKSFVAIKVRACVRSYICVRLAEHRSIPLPSPSVTANNADIASLAETFGTPHDQTPLRNAMLCYPRFASQTLNINVALQSLLVPVYIYAQALMTAKCDVEATNARGQSVVGRYRSFFICGRFRTWVSPELFNLRLALHVSVAAVFYPQRTNACTPELLSLGFSRPCPCVCVCCSDCTVQVLPMLWECTTV